MDKISASLTCGLIGEITWLQVRKELFKLFKQAFMVSSCAFMAAWGKSPAGHCQFPEGPFCKSYFWIKKILLDNSKPAKTQCERKVTCSSPDSWQELNGRRIERWFFFFFFWSSEIQETEKPICFYCFLSVTTNWGPADGRKGSCSPLSGYDLCHAKELYLIYNHTIHWLIKNKHKIQWFWAVKIKEFQVWIGFTQDRGNSLSGQRLVA